MIRKIDVEAMTIDIEVPERYPVPEVGTNELRPPFPVAPSFPTHPEGDRVMGTISMSKKSPGWTTGVTCGFT